MIVFAAAHTWKQMHHIPSCPMHWKKKYPHEVEFKKWFVYYSIQKCTSRLAWRKRLPPQTTELDEFIHSTFLFCTKTKVYTKCLNMHTGLFYSQHHACVSNNHSEPGQATREPGTVMKGHTRKLNSAGSVLIHHTK